MISKYFQGIVYKKKIKEKHNFVINVKQKLNN